MTPSEDLPADIASPWLNFAIFSLFAMVTLFFVYRVGGQGQKVDFFAAGRSFSGPQNGMALSGDFLSAASFLGIAGAVAMYGYDGFLYSIGFFVGWLINLLLIAEPARNVGRFTMGDVLVYRASQRSVRAATSVSTLVISVVYMIAQMAGAGGLFALLMDIDSPMGQALVIGMVGFLMVGYVLVGGMKGTSWVQIIKTVLLMLCMVLMALFLIGKFGFSFGDMLLKAAANNPHGTDIFGPGVSYGNSPLDRVDLISMSLAMVLGVAGLPHVLMRFYTVPDAREARRSVVWAICIIGVFYLCTLVVGLGSVAVNGTDRILAAPGGENSAVPLLAFHIGGSVLLAIVAVVAFATILSVVAGLTLTASASFAHDLYSNVFRERRRERDKVRANASSSRDGRSEVRVARVAALVMGAVAIGGGIVVNGQNVAFLVSLAYAFAASANLSSLVLSLYWRRFNATGTLWSIYGGLGSCLVLMVFSPVVSGAPNAILPSVDFAWFPLHNPGIVSVPLSFLCGIFGTLLSGQPALRRRTDEMEVKALTGLGS